jgi:hypothetical protein
VLNLASLKCTNCGKALPTSRRWLIEVAWPGTARQRWVARVGDRGSAPLPLDAAKQSALAFLRPHGKVEPRAKLNRIAKLNQIAAYEVDRATLQQERRRWPIDVMNGRRRGFVEQRAAIVEAELAMGAIDGRSLQDSDCPLDYYADGYPKLPECLRRTADPQRFRNVARAA